jgi:hypothetical protein
MYDFIMGFTIIDFILCIIVCVSFVISDNYHEWLESLFHVYVLLTIFTLLLHFSYIIVCR